jgi:hypothetical protein
MQTVHTKKTYADLYISPHSGYAVRPYHRGHREGAPVLRRQLFPGRMTTSYFVTTAGIAIQIILVPAVISPWKSPTCSGPVSEAGLTLFQ